LKPDEVAQKFQRISREKLQRIGKKVRLAGFLTHADGPSKVYADYTRAGCDSVGLEFDLRIVSRLDLERALLDANTDPSVHGIITYYPIFGTGQDTYLKDLIDHRKDVEGLSVHWLRKLYSNERHVDGNPDKKAVLPCTSLAVIKMLAATGIWGGGERQTADGKIITVFNRSEVVGRPLASMLANDGAKVYSFDVDGPILFEKGRVSETAVTRAEALAQSHIVITGVPSKAFPPVCAAELRPEAVCLNFSTLKNFSDDISGRAGVFVPRVGSVTVAMCLRNTLRLFENYQP
jgi:methylenetetrahydrofolate dehydrogenase (NADP+)/methenyltetrahydrofolate cyclohydrolase